MLRAAFADQHVLFPTQWEEVTLRQFLALADGQSLLMALASDPARLFQLPDAAAETSVLPFLAFVADAPDFAGLPPIDRLLVMVPDNKKGSSHPVTVRRPADLGGITYGQKITIDEELRRLRQADRLNYVDAALPLLSIILYPYLAEKPFLDILDTMPYEPAILNLPCTVALPLAAFFLRTSTAWTPSGAVTYAPVPTPPKWIRWWQRPGRWCRNWLSTTPTNRRTPWPSTEA